MTAFWISSAAATVLFVMSLVALFVNFDTRVLKFSQDTLLAIVLIEFVAGCAAVMW